MISRVKLIKLILAIPLAAGLIVLPYFFIYTLSYSLYFPVGIRVHLTKQPIFVFLILTSLINTAISGFFLVKGIRHRKVLRSLAAVLKYNLPNLIFSPVILINGFLSPLCFSLAQGIGFFLLVSNLQTYRIAPKKPKSRFIKQGAKKTRRGSKPGYLFSFLRTKRRVPFYCCLLLFILLAVWLYLFQLNQLNNMQLGIADIGYFFLQFKNTIEGNGFLLESISCPTFYNHFTPSSAFLVPFFAFYPRVDFFLITQSIFVAGICVIVFLYSRFVLKNPWLALGCAFCAAFAPPLSQISYRFSYAYGGVAIAIPFIILSVKFWEQKRYLLFFLIALFAALLKESIISFYVGMGLVEFLFPPQRRQRGVSFLLFFCSTILMLVVLFVIMPYFSTEDGNVQMARYSHLGDNPLEIILSPIRKPEQFWPLVINQHIGVLLALTICGAGALAILSPRHLAYSFIALLFVFIQKDNAIKSICFQYQTPFLAATLCALPHGMKRIIKWTKAKNRKLGGRKGMAIVGGMVITSVLMGHFYGLLPISRKTLPFQSKLPPSYIKDCRLIKDLASSIPPEWKILSTHRAATYFLEKKEVRVVGQADASQDFLPDMVCLDLSNMWGQSREQVEEVISEYLYKKKYHPRRIGKHFLLLQKTREPGPS